jgi:hypothetical protein
MPNRSTGGIELQLSKRSDSGGRTVTSGVDASQLLYFLLLVPELFLGQMPLGIYSPLDTRYPMGFIICTFLLPAVLQLSSIVRRQPSNGVSRWRKVSTWSGLALPLIGLVLFLNGALDRSPRIDMRATVIRKIAPTGYREAQSTLIVTSWRPGRSFEDLNVSSREFKQAVVGKGITIEMHEGRFGLPWYSNISP